MKPTSLARVSLLIGTLALVAPSVIAQQSGQSSQPDPVIVVDGIPFYSWQEYTSSPLFREKGLRCLTRPNEDLPPMPPSDCSYGTTSIKAEYDPFDVIEIPVVVHIIRSNGGQGNVTDAKVESQIQILNEDFLAIAGSNGQNGTDTLIQFYLAEVDPSGNPTTGITRTNNTNWYNDSGAYWNTLAWDTNRYLNIYTNQASGALGYVPDLPQGGIVGSKSDRVVILWSSFGLNSPIGPPYNKGRTTTHELGHYFGLWHTFDRGCGTIAGCYSTGDAICDTNRESNPVFGCPGSSNSCSSPDPYHNYMDYSDDLCMEEFTPEQTNRMRCTIEHWRSNLPCAEAKAISRAGGGNNFDNAYASTDPLIGVGLTATIDATGSGYSTVSLLGFLGEANVPLAGGQVLLLDLGTTQFLSLSQPGPIANFNLSVPNNNVLCGLKLTSQGVLFGGASGFRLTNAQDWELGK